MHVCDSSYLHLPLSSHAMIPCKVAGTNVAIVLAHTCFCAAPVADWPAQPTDPIAVKVNKLSSTKTQLPYDYYSLPYCRPQRIVNFAENLGGCQRSDGVTAAMLTSTVLLPPVMVRACSASLSKRKSCKKCQALTNVLNWQPCQQQLLQGLHESQKCYQLHRAVSQIDPFCGATCSASPVGHQGRLLVCLLCR
jgi:hypothetical protein